MKLNSCLLSSFEVQYMFAILCIQYITTLESFPAVVDTTTDVIRFILSGYAEFYNHDNDLALCLAWR